MKRILFMALLAATLSAHAATSDGDDSENTDIKLHDGETVDWIMHLAIGFNAGIDAPDGYDFAPFKSWDVQWTVFDFEYTPLNASQTYSIGFGMNWSNFALENSGAMFQKMGEVTALGQFPAATSSRYSSVHRLALDIPLLFTQRIGRHVSLSLGPVVKFNTGGWLHTRYDMGDQEYRISTKKIGLRPVTVDVMGVVDIYGIGLYCKYSPMSVFKADRGPEFKSVTFGLYF